MIKAWMKKRKEKTEARKNLKKYKKYYKLIREGLLFVEFVQNDVKDKKGNELNRAQRRRFERELNKEGKLTEEIVQHYKMKIDSVLNYINMQLNPPKIKKVKRSLKGTSEVSRVDSNTTNPFVNDEALKAEYKLIQEKKSRLTSNQRKKIVDLYKKKFGNK